jgi:hypothetical protein
MTAARSHCLASVPEGVKLWLECFVGDCESAEIIKTATSGGALLIRTWRAWSLTCSSAPVLSQAGRPTLADTGRSRRRRRHPSWHWSAADGSADRSAHSHHWDMSLRKGAVFAQAFSMRFFTLCLTRDGWPRVGRFQNTSLIAGRLVDIARRRTRVEENSELFFRLSATNHGL